MACSTYGGERRHIEGFWWVNLSERDHLEELSIDERIILKWIFKNWDENGWTGFMWFRIGTGDGESGIKPSGSIKCGGFSINPLNPKLNPICYLLALLAHHFLHVSRIRVKSLTLRLLMSYIYIYIYIYGAPILDVSGSHTTTQHSR